MKKHIIFICFVILFITGYTCMQPTKEILTCNSSYKCSIEKEYAGKFTTAKEFNIDNKTPLSYKKSKVWYTIPASIRALPIYKTAEGKDIKPFRVYTIMDTTQNVEAVLTSASKNFEAYGQNSKPGYIVQSYADMFDYISWLAYWLFFIISVYAFMCYKNKSKEKIATKTSETEESGSTAETENNPTENR